VKAAAFDDLVALGDDLRALDLDISMPGVAPEAVADYTAAIDGYQEASLRFDRVATTAALRPVSEALEEGRFRLACAQARLAGGRSPPGGGRASSTRGTARRRPTCCGRRPAAWPG